MKIIYWPESETQPRVVLTFDQQTIVTLNASLRFSVNAAYYTGANSRQRSTDHPFFLHLEGYGAEIAFASKFNLFPDFTYNPRKGGSDVVTRDGKTVDVKQTKIENGHLLVNPEKAREPSDLYVLMVGEFPAYRYAGYATKEQLFRPESLKDFGYGPSYAIEQKDLQT